LNKFIYILVLIFTFNSKSYGWQCREDGRTLTELLFSTRPGTIFTCKIIFEIPPSYTDRKIDTSNRKGVRIGGYNGKISDRNEFNQFQYWAKVQKVFFGKVDSEIVRVISMSEFTIDSNYLMYASENGKEFYAGGPCDRRTKIVNNEIAIVEEIKIIETISNYLTKKKTKKIKLLNSLGGTLVEGRLKKGNPVGRWKYYYENSNIKLEKDYKSKSEMRFYSNGKKYVYLYIKNDTVFHYQYKNDSSNCLESLEKDIPPISNDTQVWYFETYENCKLKQIHYQQNGIGLINEFKEYYDNGQIKIDGNYIKAIKAGTWTEYDRNGKIIKTEQF
jgi:antitoxin component YwqK of YwqJK toxin-antitoxin module